MLLLTKREKKLDIARQGWIYYLYDGFREAKSPANSFNMANSSFPVALHNEYNLEVEFLNKMAGLSTQ